MATPRDTCTSPSHPPAPLTPSTDAQQYCYTPLSSRNLDRSHLPQYRGNMSRTATESRPRQKQHRTPKEGNRKREGKTRALKLLQRKQKTGKTCRTHKRHISRRAKNTRSIVEKKPPPRQKLHARRARTHARATPENSPENSKARQDRDSIARYRQVSQTGEIRYHRWISYFSA